MRKSYKLLPLIEEKLSGEVERVRKLFNLVFERYMAARDRKTRLVFMRDIITQNVHGADLKLLILILQKEVSPTKKK